ncbi:hypothetical protein SAMN05192575_101171 [Nocardioides alpinus]|uniref:Uncharacterized protein n=1 Tax=Nocardioides alpinus TaxID=748909 RepID=A0A1I0VGZ3_9ACTN|nr:hypothetical protein [Nocardioides alpinus]PKH37230.1 hypothetical protein CXG46_17255 [Nocardioides alpinus]SFA74846.1 hypothetical protein SAMN05192575_101171 [Nocardioides alpinus]
MTSRTTADLVSSYVRSLRWQVPLALVAVLALWAFDVGGVRDVGPGRILLLGIGCLVVLSPLLWLRYEFTWERDRQLAVLLGWSIAWLVVGTVVMLALAG